MKTLFLVCGQSKETIKNLYLSISLQSLQGELGTIRDSGDFPVSPYRKPTAKKIMAPNAPITKWCKIESPRC